MPSARDVPSHTEPADLRWDADPAPEALARLDAECFPQVWDADTYRQELDSPFGACWAIRVGDSPEASGWILCRVITAEAEILRIGIRPSERNRGLGRALLRGALARLAANGVARVFLEVRESNAEARRLYSSAGFGETGRRRSYYQEPEEDAVVMSLEFR